jgi:ubiquinol-cytochrome c reductase cytochrome c subunit
MAVLVLGLVVTGTAYAFVGASGSASAAAPKADNQTQIEQGRQLFLEGCASCHGLGAQGTGSGPSLIGVGAAAVDFQVGTGRMPLAEPEAQAPAKAPAYDDDQIAALAAYIASLAPGPAIPTDSQLDTSDADLATGGILFRTSCAQCHNFAGQGGALTNGQYAPSLMDASSRHIWEAMVTGPQSMPVFSTLSEQDKQNIIKYVQYLQTAPNPGGSGLGRVGPVTEGIVIWTVGLGLVIAVAIWIGAKVS